MTGREAIEKSKHFSLSENWGDPDKVHPGLVMLADDFRDMLGYGLYISPVKGAVYAENEGHADKSWHYIIPGRNDLAMAMDVFPETSDVVAAFLLAVKMGFGGIGYYPYASWPAKKLCGMLHIDVRHLIRSGRQAWWLETASKARVSISTLNELVYFVDTATAAERYNFKKMEG